MGSLEELLVRHTVQVGGDATAMRNAIAGLAVCLTTGNGAAFELSELASRFGRHMRLGDETRPDLALCRLAGTEIVLVAGMAAIGQRAGFRVDVLLGPTRTFVGHYDAPSPVAISPRDGFLLVDTRECGEPLTWASPQQVGERLSSPLTAW